MGIICTLGTRKISENSFVVSKKYKWKPLQIGHRSIPFSYTVRPSPPVGYHDSQQYLILNELGHLPLYYRILNMVTKPASVKKTNKKKKPHTILSSLHTHLKL